MELLWLILMISLILIVPEKRYWTLVSRFLNNLQKVCVICTLYGHKCMDDSMVGEWFLIVAYCNCRSEAEEEMKITVNVFNAVRKERAMKKTGLWEAEIIAPRNYI